MSLLHLINKVQNFIEINKQKEEERRLLLKKIKELEEENKNISNDIIALKLLKRILTDL